MSRYPYTYAADYIRSIAGHNEQGQGTKLSRAEASQIISEIADKIEMDKQTIAEKLADAELNKTEEDHMSQAQSFFDHLSKNFNNT